ncbi:BTAD domain-containing putative transcriptional regulator, partial [Armatimonas sp.]|uniref:BTAD domain-containing putative transcriptional regulator n=1 Tax=Armatimonas sp. TaxID=1872638 RepID=UPI0037523207
MLAYLASNQRHPHRRETLAQYLWPDSPPDVVRTSLRTAIASLRRQLEPGPQGESLLLVTPTTIALNLGVVSIDVVEYERAWRAASTITVPAMSDEEKLRSLEWAVALYQGIFLEGYPGGSWLDNERARLGMLHNEVRLSLLRLLERSGRPDAALPLAQSLVHDDPLLEEAHAVLMRLYAAHGRTAAALRQYRTLKRTLQREVGEPPSEEMMRLARTLRKGGKTYAPPAPASAHPPTPLPSATPLLKEHRFPVVLGTLYGREEEAEKVLGLLRGAYRSLDTGLRQVTLTGTGGVGKTRLALEIARRATSEYAGVYFVPLAGLTWGESATEQMLAAILQALREQPSPQIALREQVIHSLNRRPASLPLLMVLDNFEQLLSADISAPPAKGDPGECVAYLLNHASHLRCVVTSRRQLRLPDEHIVALSPLAVPFPGWELERIRDSPSVRLFVDRARVRQVDFAVTARNAAILAEICSALEGVPLAIELAAARAYLIPITEMRNHLQTPFEFLVDPSRPRQRQDVRHLTLRNTIAWSYRLLTSSQKDLFARLSVFSGFDISSVATLLGLDEKSMLESIEDLRESSLVEAGPGEAPGRFRMLEAIREFAAQELGVTETRELRQRHAEYFLNHARKAIEASRGPDQALWLARLDDDVDNLRTALGFSIGSELGHRLTAALHHFWYVRGHLNEGRRWMRQALATYPEPPDILLSGTLNALGVFAWTQRDFDEAQKHFATALLVREKAEDPVGIAGVHNNMGMLALQRGDLSAAAFHLDTSITLFRTTDHSAQLAHALYN